MTLRGTASLDYRDHVADWCHRRFDEPDTLPVTLTNFLFGTSATHRLTKRLSREPKWIAVPYFGLARQNLSKLVSNLVDSNRSLALEPCTISMTALSPSQIFLTPDGSERSRLRVSRQFVTIRRPLSPVAKDFEPWFSRSRNIRAPLAFSDFFFFFDRNTTRASFHVFSRSEMNCATASFDCQFGGPRAYRP